MLISLLLWLLLFQLPNTVVTNGSGSPAGSCVSGSTYTDSSTGFAWTCKGSAWQLVATSAVLTGTTGSIGGSALLLGACATGTATVTGATAGQNVIVNTADGTFLGSSFSIQGNVSSSNTVTVNVCAIVAGTPASKTYNVRVVP